MSRTKLDLNRQWEEDLENRRSGNLPKDTWPSPEFYQTRGYTWDGGMGDAYLEKFIDEKSLTSVTVAAFPEWCIPTSNKEVLVVIYFQGDYYESCSLHRPTEALLADVILAYEAEAKRLVSEYTPNKSKVDMVRREIIELPKSDDVITRFT